MKLYYKSNNPAISPPLKLSKAQPDRSEGKDSSLRGLTCQSPAPHLTPPLLKPSDPSQLPDLPTPAAWPRPHTIPPPHPTSPLSKSSDPTPQPQPRRIPPTRTQCRLFPADRPLLPAALPPATHPTSLPGFTPLLPTSPPGITASLPQLVSLCSFTRLLLAIAAPENASQLLPPAEPETHPKGYTYKNLHAKDFRAEEYEIPGGKKNLKN